MPVDVVTYVGLQLDPESDEAKKKREADRLRKAEKFMTIGTGRALCVSCGYEYEAKRGDPEYPITPGTQFPVGPTPVMAKQVPY